MTQMIFIVFYLENKIIISDLHLDAHRILKMMTKLKCEKIIRFNYINNDILVP
jgi:hypothetical protein